MNLLFLSGPHAVGKTYLTDQFVKNNPSIVKFDSGPTMRKFYQKYGTEQSIKQWVINLHQKYGDKITCFMLAKSLKDEMKNKNSTNAIIIGFRELKGIKYMIDILKPDKVSVMFLDAPANILFENYNKRLNNGMNDRKDVKLDYNEFKQYLNEELIDGLSEIKQFSKTSQYGTYLFKENNYLPISPISDFFERGIPENEK